MPKIDLYSLSYCVNLYKHLHILERNAGSNGKVKESKVLFRLLKIFGGVLLLLLVLMYLGLGLYFSTNKDKLKSDLVELVNQNSSGEIQVGDLEVSLFRGFPSVTIQIKDVIVKDSLWNLHKRTLLKADKVFVKVSPWAILSKSITINNFTIKNAVIDIYVDDKGYSNVSVFSHLKKEKPTSDKSSLDVGIDKLHFSDVTIISENQIKRKQFNFKTSNLDANVSHNSTGWSAYADVKTLVNSMVFNTTRGSFAKDKIIKGKIAVVYNGVKKQIGVYSEELNIGGNSFEFKATFGASKTNSLFKVLLFSPSIKWKEASSLLSNNIKSKLGKFDLKKPFDVRAEIKGNMRVRGNPGIHVIAHMKDNELITKNAIIGECGFKAEFTNNHVKNGVFGDPNSAIFLHDFKGSYNEIAFTTKDFMIYNLKKPTASGSLKTNFDATSLNSVFDKELLQFKKGKADVSVQFKANVVDLDITKPFITGNVNIENTDLTYGKSKFNVRDCNLVLKFTPEELDIESFRFATERSMFNMKGYAGNFMNLYYDNPEKIVLNLDIDCPQIDLSEFLFLIGSKKNNKQKKAPKSKSEFLEKTLSSSSLAINLKVDKLIYKKFTGTHAVAKIRMSNDSIAIKQVAIQKNRGAIDLKGLIKHSTNKDNFKIDLNVTKLDVRDLLYSFDNFGSATITYKNIRGVIDLDTNLNGMITDQGGLSKNSLQGNLQFNLRNGAFIHFEPLEKVGKTVFPKRNFGKVTFANIDGDFKINGGKVYVSPMQINTNVLNLDLSGVYAFESGTNLNVVVYLRNPEKDKDEKNKGIFNLRKQKENRDKGVSVHLLATDGADGKVKVKLKNLKSK